MICDGCEWFNLQEEVRSADAAVLTAQPRIRHFGDELAEFADAAALCALMDVVVSVDTRCYASSRCAGPASSRACSGNCRRCDQFEAISLISAAMPPASSVSIRSSSVSSFAAAASGRA